MEYFLKNRAYLLFIILLATGWSLQSNTVKTPDPYAINRIYIIPPFIDDSIKNDIDANWMALKIVDSLDYIITSENIFSNSIGSYNEIIPEDSSNQFILTNPEDLDSITLQYLFSTLKLNTIIFITIEKIFSVYQIQIYTIKYNDFLRKKIFDSIIDKTHFLEGLETFYKRISRELFDFDTFSLNISSNLSNSLIHFDTPNYTFSINDAVLQFLPTSIFKDSKKYLVTSEGYDVVTGTLGPIINDKVDLSVNFEKSESKRTLIQTNTINSNLYKQTSFLGVLPLVIDETVYPEIFQITGDEIANKKIISLGTPLLEIKALPGWFNIELELKNKQQKFYNALGSTILSSVLPIFAQNMYKHTGNQVWQNMEIFLYSITGTLVVDSIIKLYEYYQQINKQ